jgi:GNAT superfamily N-acetyltransferase
VRDTLVSNQTIALLTWGVLTEWQGCFTVVLGLDLYVRDGYRCIGLGNHLVDRLIKVAEDLGADARRSAEESAVRAHRWTFRGGCAAWLFTDVA